MSFNKDILSNKQSSVFIKNNKEIQPIKTVKTKEIKPTLLDRLNLAEFDENDVKTRPGYANKQISYIDRFVTVKQLNRLFGMQWSFEITHLEEKMIEGRHVGTTTIGKLTIDTKELKRSVMDVGYAEGATPSKSSATDCLKRCSAIILPMINLLYSDNN